MKKPQQLSFGYMAISFLGGISIITGLIKNNYLLGSVGFLLALILLELFEIKELLENKQTENVVLEKNNSTSTAPNDFHLGKSSRH